MEARHTLWERIWHWLQAGLIILLLITGFQMHYPDQLIIFKHLCEALNLHLRLGAGLFINSLLGLFYQITTGKIFHYIPTGDTILYGAVKQAGYYLSGIFHHAEPPFKLDMHSRFNPLQRITYFTLLIILIPLQLCSGIILFYGADPGADLWPLVFTRLGGFQIIAPIHTLLAYFFLSFLIVHIYLSTTTADTPFALLRQMTIGE